MLNKIKSEKFLFYAFLLFCFLNYLLWSLSKGFNFGPDEYVRYDLPLYIYEHGVLPNGFIDEIRNEYWGFSYAYYPTFLGPVLSALFMKIISVFTTDGFWLLAAARFTSVIFGTLTVYFVYKIGEKLFTGEYKWFMTVFLAMIPQYTFLTSYVNNDIICICGSAIIIYAWVRGMTEMWNLKNAILLSVGIVICALSYYNSYGWIALSIIVCAVSYIWKINKNRDYKTMFKLAGVVSGIVLVCVSYFFIRNALLYNGDFLGMKTLTEASEMYAIDELKPSLRNTPEHMGVSYFYMLFNMGWLKDTYKSFIGNFGYVNVFCPRWLYVLYLHIVLLSLTGIAFSIARAIKLKRKISKVKWVMHLALAAGMAMVVALSLYYSYYTDYQPQGRYCYPMIVAFAYFIAYGFSKLPVLESNLTAKRRLINILSVLLVLTNIYCYCCVFLPA